MANPNYTGKPIATVPELLRVGMNKLPDYIHDAADLRQLQLSLAESMYDSGNYEDARAAFSRIIASAAADGAMADEALAKTLAGAIEIDLGNVAAGRRLGAEALALSRAQDIPPRVRVLSEVYFAYNEDNNGFRTDENLRLLRAAAQEARDAHLAPDDMAQVLSSLAAILQLRGQNLEAKTLFEELLSLYEKDPLALCDRSDVYGWLAAIANSSGDVPGSLQLYRNAYDGYVACSGADSGGALNELPYLAGALLQSGRAPEAVGFMENALPAWRRVAGGKPGGNDMLYFLARGYVALGRYGDAERTANELLARITGKLAPDSRTIGIAHLVLGQALAGQQRYRDAMPHAKIAVDLLVKSATASPYSRQTAVEAMSLAEQIDASLKK
jgi:tetratricopeptide (TPR) repeat protein